MTLPSIVAVWAHGRHTGVIAIYDTTQSRSYEIEHSYVIAPHRFYQQAPTPTFLVWDRPAGDPFPRLTLYEDYRRDRRFDDAAGILYRGRPHSTGESIYCVYHPLPIPVIDFGDTVSLPTTPDCQLDIMIGDRHMLRFWERRWAPEFIARDLHDEARPATHEARPATHEARPQTKPIPGFVTALILADAVAKHTICPITLEPIAAETGTVTPCYHVFDAAALHRWRTQHTAPLCPTCKTPLTV